MVGSVPNELFSVAYFGGFQATCRCSSNANVMLLESFAGNKRTHTITHLDQCTTISLTFHKVILFVRVLLFVTRS